MVSTSISMQLPQEPSEVCFASDHLVFECRRRLIANLYFANLDDAVRVLPFAGAEKPTGGREDINFDCLISRH